MILHLPEEYIQDIQKLVTYEVNKQLEERDRENQTVHLTKKERELLRIAVQDQIQFTYREANKLNEKQK